MKRSRFSDEQIIVNEQEAGMATTEVCRRKGISGATFYKWKSKYGGLEVYEAKRLRSPRNENASLKKLLAEALLDIAVLKDISAKMYGPPRLASEMNRWRHSLPECIRPVCGTSRSLAMMGCAHDGAHKWSSLIAAFLNQTFNGATTAVSNFNGPGI